jgi:hypothetical protein
VSGNRGVRPTFLTLAESFTPLYLSVSVRILGATAPQGDAYRERCALARLCSDSHFKQPSVGVLAPPREVGF